MLLPPFWGLMPCNSQIPEFSPASLELAPNQDSGDKGSSMALHVCPKRKDGGKVASSYGPPPYGVIVT